MTKEQIAAAHELFEGFPSGECSTSFSGSDLVVRRGKQTIGGRYPDRIIVKPDGTQVWERRGGQVIPNWKV